jgi:hypothetical protein
MRRVRSNIRFAAWLALFAVALQLVLSFGHTHFHVTVGDAVATSASANPADKPDAQDPAAPSKHPKYTDLCAICANLHLAGSIQFPDAVVLPLPPVRGTARPQWHGAFRLAAAHRAPFEARGPPLV